MKEQASSSESPASLLFGVGRILRERISRDKNKDPATFIDMKTLAMISQERQPTMKDIAGCLYVASPTATVIVDRLVDQNLVSRSPDPKDRRIIRLSITAKGKKVLAKGTQDIDEAMDSLLSSLSAADKGKLQSLLQKIITTNQH